jgi:surface protein
MESMFLFCNKLTSLDVSNFKTENVTNMSNMFRGCRKLTSLDVYSFNTEKVTDMLCMFTWCDDLTTIYVSDKFVTTNVQDCVDMFDGCYNLKGAIEYDSNKTDYKYANYTTGYFTLKPSTAYVVFDATNGTLTFRYDGGKPEGAYDLNEGNNSPTWAKHAANIKKVVFAASFAKARPTSCYNWFRYCEKLTQIEGIEHLNTEEVTDMSWMFMDCRGLTSLDVSHFNTQKVTNMEQMFNRCSGLTSLEVSNFNTENVTNMTCIFLGCSGLTSLDVSHFNTEKVTDMSCMFYECGKLTSLDVSHFNTGNVTKMGFMFFNCSALTLLDLTNFNTAKVVDMGGMLILCSALTTIYVSDKFVTTNITERGSMFYGCTSLKGAIAYDKNKYDDTYANYRTGYFTKQVGMNGSEKIGASGETLTAASLALDDEKDFVAYEPFTATTATYNREMKAGTTWATLCLPFEVSLADKNFRAFKLLSANESTSTIQLEEITTSITAGTPVIIKMNNGETTLSISEANKEIAQKVVSAADGNYQLQGIYTQKVFDKVADNNCYIVKGDKLMNPTKLLEYTSTTQVGSKPFRAYMVDNTSSSAGAKMFSIAIGDNTTAIDSLNTIADDKAVYYDLQGNRLSAPQKGINIVKRGSKTMKVIIK